MVLLAALQLALRWTLSTGLEWADLQLRQLVLWVGLLGGVLASANRRHLRMDLAEHHLPVSVRNLVLRFVSAVGALISLVLAYLSVGFIHSEVQSGGKLDRIMFGMSLRQWIPEVVIVAGFALMGVYFLAAAVLPVSQETGDHSG
jgi:TRAP-type C4-dicarboxylate transport system permease small subunit